MKICFNNKKVIETSRDIFPLLSFILFVLFTASLYVEDVKYTHAQSWDTPEFRKSVGAPDDSTNDEVNYLGLEDQGYGVGRRITNPRGNLQGLISISLTIFSLIATVIISLAVLYFLLGLLKYLKSSDSSDKAEAKGMIVNGIIILFAMVSVWSLVAVISSTLEIDLGGGSTLPRNEIPVNSLIKK